MPIGTQINYFGTGIKGSLRSRDYEISIANGDDFDLIGWFVANGEAATVDVMDKFSRWGSASGGTGGSNDAVLVSHNHTFSGPGDVGTDYRGIAELQDDTGLSQYQYPVSSAGVSATGKNVPEYINSIPVVRMS